jgi:hypothetical protein
MSCTCQRMTDKDEHERFALEADIDGDCAIFGD